MRDEPNAKPHPAAGLAAGVPWRVVEVHALPGHRLAVRFVDGTQGEVDISRLVFGKRAGVFERLRDPAAFARVGIDQGAVAWDGELDLAPDAMYEEIKARGSWMVE